MAKNQGRRVSLADDMAVAWRGTKAAWKLQAAIMAGHNMDWVYSGSRKHPECSCGWKAPARGKLSHSMSDVRDHLFAVWRETNEAGKAEMARSVGEELSARLDSNTGTEDVGSRTTPEQGHPDFSVVFSRPA